MAKSKIMISLDESTLDRLDKLVEKAPFTSRSQTIQEAVGKNWRGSIEAAWLGSA